MQEIIEQAQQTEPIQTPAPAKKAISWQALNKPWILAVGPLTAGAIWLVNNTWIITDNLNKPYLLLAGPATIASIIALWLIINFFKVIASWCRSFGQASLAYLKKPGSKYWIATTIFLLVSMMESGTCFGGLLGGDWFDRIIGYAIALAIDSVSIICILARQGAVRRNDKVGQWLYMIGIIICAGMSTLANGYIAKEHYTAPIGMGGAIWHDIAMLLMIAPPLLVVFLGFASDYTSDQASSDLDPDAYEESEKKRIRFIEIQRDSIKKKKAIQNEIKSMDESRPRRTFILIEMLFPVKSLPAAFQNELSLLNDSLSGLKGEIETISNSSSGLKSEILHTVKSEIEKISQSSSELKSELSKVKSEIAPVSTFQNELYEMKIFTQSLISEFNVNVTEIKDELKTEIENLQLPAPT